jgi:hypothetical protein
VGALAESWDTEETERIILNSEGLYLLYMDRAKAARAELDPAGALARLVIEDLEAGAFPGVDPRRVSAVEVARTILAG